MRTSIFHIIIEEDNTCVHETSTARPSPLIVHGKIEFLLIYSYSFIERCKYKSNNKSGRLEHFSLSKTMYFKLLRFLQSHKTDHCL